MIENSALRRLHREPFKDFLLGHELLATVRANAPDESLRASHDDRAGDQKRLDPHIVETRDRARSVVRVKRAQDLVTGQSGFHGNIGRFVVTNFAHHHDIRILPKNRAKR